MAQQVSIEAVYDSYRERAAELFHENVLLKARARELEAELASLHNQELPTSQIMTPEYTNL